MATSLYDLAVPTFLQTVKAVGGFLDRAVRHCAETQADPDDFVHARLFDDMAPFHFQIEAAWHHSVWGLEAVKTGVFAPPALIGAQPFTDLQAMIAEAVKALEALTPMRSTAGRARTWTSRSARAGSLSRRRPSSSRFRCPISISTPSPPTTSCARGACRSASAITRAGCAPDRLRSARERPASLPRSAWSPAPSRFLNHEPHEPHDRKLQRRPIAAWS